MRFQLPELHCFYVPGLFFTRLQNSRNLSKQQTFRQLFRLFFPSVFRRRRISVPGIRTHKKKAARRNGTAQKPGKVFCKATRR